MGIKVNIELPENIYKKLETLSKVKKKKLKDCARELIETTIELQKPAGETKKSSLKGIIDLVKTCQDKDLSVNHDKYLYGF